MTNAYHHPTFTSLCSGKTTNNSVIAGFSRPLVGAVTCSLGRPRGKKSFIISLGSKEQAIVQRNKSPIDPPIFPFSIPFVTSILALFDSSLFSFYSPHYGTIR